MHTNQNNLILDFTALQASSQESYITHDMLYRYCRMIFIIPTGQRWSIFNLLEDGSTGRLLRNDRRVSIKPGNYIVLGHQGEYPLLLSVEIQGPNTH